MAEPHIPTLATAAIDRDNAAAWALRFSDPLASAAQARVLHATCLDRGDRTGAVLALFTLGHAAFACSEYPRALACAEEAVALTSGRGDRLEARAWVRLAVAQVDGERYDAAEATLREATRLCVASGFAAGSAELQHTRAYAQIARGNFTAALGLLSDPIAVAGDDDADHARYEHLVTITHSYLGDRAATAQHLARALVHAERCGDRRRAALLRGLEASLHEAAGELGPALEAYIAMLHELQCLERLGLGLSPAASEALEHITDIYIRLGDLERARRYAEDGLRIAEQGSRGRDLAAMHARLGHLQRLAAEPAAGATLRAAGELARAVGDQHVEARVLCDLGLLEVEHDPAHALEQVDAALAIASGNGLSGDRTAFCLARARALGALGRADEVPAALEDALDLARRHGYRALEAQAHAELAACRRAAGELELAFEHLERHGALDHALLEQRFAERTRTLTLRFDRARAEEAAALERARSAELERLNAELEAKSELNAELLAQVRRQAAELALQAEEDALTGIANRRSLETRLKRAFADARADAGTLCVAMLDIDDFKRINDERSHQLGDAVLCAVSGILERAVRASDFVARYGGEEFVIVLPGTTPSVAATVCERIRGAIACHPWSALDPALAVTVSIGVADDRGAGDHEQVLTRADRRMYEAKRAGKDRVVAAVI